jgi:integrase/recombinase XerD
MNTNGTLPALLESFFTERMMRQRQASPHTIASYRDGFRLLLEYAQNRLKKPPSSLNLQDLDAPFVSGFLDFLERERKCSARSRNLRLSAVHSFFRYAAFQEPGLSEIIQRVLSIPPKRFTRRVVGFLTKPEIEAILQAPNRRTWAGRRDHALMLTAVQTGLRVSEVTGLRREDVRLEAGPHVYCQGKGRKERCTPLTKQGAGVLRAWLKERGGQPSDPLFPSVRGGILSRDGVEYLLAKHVTAAHKRCPTLKRKRVSPHVLRHSAAMNLLHSGVDRSVIALWLGHESVETTQMYLDANLAMKQKVIDKTASKRGYKGRYRPTDKLLAFLKGL